MAQKTKILIADDHAVVRAGVCELLAQMDDAEISEASSGQEALNAIRNAPPNIILLDISLPDMSGFEVLKRLNSSLGETKPLVVMFSMTSDITSALSALRLGAVGFISKSAAARDLPKILTQVMEGSQYLDPELAETIAFLPAGIELDPLTRLTPRERQILDLIGNGHSITNIAKRLGLKYKTIANARVALKSKLGLESGAAVRRYSILSAKLNSNNV